MKRGHVTDTLWRGFGLAVVLFMLLPLFLVVLFSFNESALTSLPITGLTLSWYERLFEHRSFWPAFENSLIIGFTVAICSVAIGTLAALALSTVKPKRAGLIMNALSLPVMLPALIIGIALLCYFVRFLDVKLSLLTVMLGHLVIALSIVIVSA